MHLERKKSQGAAGIRASQPPDCVSADEINLIFNGENTNIPGRWQLQRPTNPTAVLPNIVYYSLD